MTAEILGWAAVVIGIGNAGAIVHTRAAIARMIGHRR